MKRLLAILFILPLLLGSCSMYDASNQADADKIVSQLHEDYKNREWGKLLSLYDDKFFAERSREDWRNELQALLETHGEIKEFKPVFHQKDPRLEGDFYLYGFKISFENGAVDETITVMKSIQSDKLTIIGHLIQPRNH